MTGLTPNALRVLEARYLRRDAERRVVESPEQMFRRVARAVAQGELLLGTAAEADRYQERFDRLLSALDFLPNSPTLMNAGSPLGQLAACYVLPIEDSIESIFGALRAMALLQCTGGGTGFAFSHLRPRGDVVASTGGEASGPVSFMRVFDCATEHVKQGGRRRGANMGVLRVDHPDAMEFITAKRTPGSLSNFTLSVAVTDRFMEAAAAGEACEVVHPRHGRVVGRRPAAAVLDAIVQSAWQTGDPGLLFLDAIQRANPAPALGEIETTNPCGEVPLLPWERCVLGSVNLAHMLTAPPGAPGVDWERLRRTVHLGVRFLDDVLEVTRDPLPEIAAASRRLRKIGLGVMGFAEMLIRLGIPYGSPRAIACADRLMGFVAEEARAASRTLAEERGVFPAWPLTVHAARGDRRRHATCLSIAPTGTLSIIADTSAGIEPIFALAYRHADSLGGPPLVEINPVVRRWLQARSLDAPALLHHVAATGTLREAPGVGAEARALFATATELDVDVHLAVQRAFQRHVDNAVSKTVNLPPEATPATVAAAYQRGWRLGLKGVTVYRAHSRAGEVLTLGADEDWPAREHFARCDPGACRL